MSIFGRRPGLLETLVSDDLDVTDNNGQRLADLLRESDPQAYNRAVARNAQRLSVPTFPRLTKAQLQEMAPELQLDVQQSGGQVIVNIIIVVQPEALGDE
jgi:hypothetical protein